MPITFHLDRRDGRREFNRTAELPKRRSLGPVAQTENLRRRAATIFQTNPRKLRDNLVERNFSVKQSDYMAVEAVIGEPVSVSHFPVVRENTGNFGARGWLWRSCPRISEQIQIVPSDSLTFGTGNFAERTANSTYRNKEFFLRLAKGVGSVHIEVPSSRPLLTHFGHCAVEARPMATSFSRETQPSTRLKRTRRGDIVFGRRGGGPLRETPRQSLLVA